MHFKFCEALPEFEEEPETERLFKEMKRREF